MTDDLVLRLKQMEEFFHLDYHRIKKISREAADHIAKLEALVKQLRDDNSSMIDDYDTDFLRQENRIEKLEAALQKVLARCSWYEIALYNDVEEIIRKALEGKDD